MIAAALSLVAVIYNNALNQSESFHGWAYLPLNLAFVAVMTFVGASMLDLSTEDLGLVADVADVRGPLVIVAIVAVGMFGIARSRYRHRIVDARVADRRGLRLVYYVLVRIPVGTAVAEEVLFRGTLFAAWREAGVSTLIAAVSTSVAFGLWHIAPTVIGMRRNDPTVSPRKVSAAVLGAVTVTTIVGLGLTWLRLSTGGLVAPIVAHAGVNSVSALASVSAARASDPS